MKQDMPRKATVDSKKIAELVFEKIFPVLNGEPTDAMVLSLICAAALAMQPNCSTEKLQQVIMDTSGHLVMQLQASDSIGQAN